MDPDVTCWSGRGCPIVVHYGADLQLVHGLRCYGNIMRTRNVSEYILVLAVCLVVYCLVQEDFIAQSASSDGDVDRTERIRVYEELWKKCNNKIQVNFVSLPSYVCNVD